MSAQLHAGIPRSGWILIAYGVVSVLFGVFALAKPFAAVAAVTWAFGFMALAEGAISLFALFDRNASIPKRWLALYALSSVAFGLVALVNPIATASVLLMFLAAWLIVSGIHRVVFAVRVRQAIDDEWMIILTGVLAIVLGVLFLAYPISALLGWMLWIGLAAIACGVLQLIVGLRLRSFGN